MQTVEVCLVSYASAAHLRAAVGSVQACLPGAAIALQENAAAHEHADAARVLLADHALPWRVEHDPTNPGFGAACNALARTSSATWLMFLNPDAEIRRWDADLGALPGGVIYGPRSYTGRRADSHRGRTYRVRDEIARSWLRRPGPPPDGSGFVSGAALLVERDTFLSLGGFDPAYFLYYEDIDLCLRANAAGVATSGLDGWAVHHDGAHSTAADPTLALTRSYVSGCRFHRAHGHPERGFQAYVAVDALARAALHLARRSSARSGAYARLARRAAADAVKGAHP